MPKNIIEQAIDDANKLQNLIAIKVERHQMQSLSPNSLKVAKALLEQGGMINEEDINDMALPPPPGEGGPSDLMNPDAGGGVMADPNADPNAGDGIPPKEDPVTGMLGGSGSDEDTRILEGIPAGILDGSGNLNPQKTAQGSVPGESVQPEEQVTIGLTELMGAVQEQDDQLTALKEAILKSVMDECGGSCGAKKKQLGEDMTPPVTDNSTVATLNDPVYEVSESQLEEMVMTMLESLIVQYSEAGTGHTNRATTEEYEFAEEIFKAKKKLEDSVKETKNVSKDLKILKESLKRKMQETKTLSETNKLFKEHIEKLSQEKSHLILENTKKDYVIKFQQLDGASSRKKTLFATQMLKARTLAEARTVYETSIGILTEQQSEVASRSSSPLTRNSRVISEIKASQTRKNNIFESVQTPQGDEMQEILGEVYNTQMWRGFINNNDL